jgi:hypothetical protein
VVIRQGSAPHSSYGQLFELHIQPCLEDNLHFTRSDASTAYKHWLLTLFPFINTQLLVLANMVRLSTYLAATAALALNAQAESMYSKKSGVLNIAGTDYDRVIAKSNYTSVRQESQQAATIAYH